MRKHVYILLAIFSFTLISSNKEVKRVNQLTDTQSVIKALYIYTFATLIDWPANLRKGDFEIAVLGSKTAVFKELNDKYAGKSIGSQEIVIKNYTNQSEINNAHILYITEEKSQYISSLAEQLKPKSTLIVSERPGGLSRGAIVNFIVEGNIQKYEINLKNAKRHSLVIASKLANLAANRVE
ncbi:YfiR family protein [Crocinitomix catalasitica]|uniref:YfiR family protein n=1 Tax=Crocinitomix catalasitica TaxID=184607 RepID=UPI000489333A|nr:YfiR family protein [Crocinitomix catalasitica]